MQVLPAFSISCRAVVTPEFAIASFGVRVLASTFADAFAFELTSAFDTRLVQP